METPFSKFSLVEVLIVHIFGISRIPWTCWRLCYVCFRFIFLCFWGNITVSSLSREVFLLLLFFFYLGRNHNSCSYFTVCLLVGKPSVFANFFYNVIMSDLFFWSFPEFVICFTIIGKWCICEIKSVSWLIICCCV